jgi:hypothetical protein
MRVSIVARQFRVLINDLRGDLWDNSRLWGLIEVVLARLQTWAAANGAHLSRRVKKYQVPASSNDVRVLELPDDSRRVISVEYLDGNDPPRRIDRARYGERHAEAQSSDEPTYTTEGNRILISAPYAMTVVVSYEPALVEISDDMQELELPNYLEALLVAEMVHAASAGTSEMEGYRLQQLGNLRKDALSVLKQEQGPTYSEPWRAR